MGKRPFKIEIITEKMALQGHSYGTESEIIGELKKLKIKGTYRLYGIPSRDCGYDQTELVVSCNNDDLEDEFIKAKTKEIEKKYEELFNDRIKEAKAAIEGNLEVRTGDY